MAWLFKRLRMNGRDKALASNFLRVFQRVSARQQLALEDWNDALEAQATQPVGGDEISGAPLVEINEVYAARLLPVAERRLASALEMRSEFAKLETAEMFDTLLFGKLDSLLLAFDAWPRFFDLHAERCEKTVRDLRSLIAGDRSADNDEEQRLRSEVSLAMDQAVSAQQAVMERYGISSAELLKMKFAACNDLRLELGKPKLSIAEFESILYAPGLAGERARFYA